MLCMRVDNGMSAVPGHSHTGYSQPGIDLVLLQFAIGICLATVLSSDAGLGVPGTWYLVPVGHPAKMSIYSKFARLNVSIAGCPLVPGTWYLVPGTWYRPIRM